MKQKQSERKIFTVDVGKMSPKEARKIMDELFCKSTGKKPRKSRWYDFFVPPAIIIDI